jgi:tetratricopeptide (TPR) repeat protein
MKLLPILWWAAAGATQTIVVDQYPLRTGCGDGDRVVANLPAGAEVRVKFALVAGAQPCYLVSTSAGGENREGWVRAEALSDAQGFEEQRKAAAPVLVTAPLRPPSSTSAPRAADPPGPRQFTVPLAIHGEVQRAMELIQRNQPDQAQQIMERLLRQHPRNAGLLAVAGMAAYRNDRLPDALAYWRESLDLKPDADLEQWYLDARREAAADRSVETKVGMRFTLRYDGAVADSGTASTMVSILEEEFSRIASELGCRADERIVTIVQSRENYFKGTRAAEWSAASYDGKIRVPLIDRNRLSPDIRSTFAHEIVHACLANLGPWPTWLHEGLAQRLSGTQASPEARSRLGELARSGKLPRLEQLAGSWNQLGHQEASLAYAIAYEAVDLFYRHHSAYGIRNLLRNPDQLARIAADLDRRLQALR